jgi:hypothetical protein
MATPSPSAETSRSPTSKVAPYHTTVPEYGAKRYVYHNDDACPDGKLIKLEHRTAGTAGLALCKECVRL